MEMQDLQPTSPLAVRSTNTVMPKPVSSRLPVKQPTVPRFNADITMSSTENVPCQPSAQPIQQELAAARPAKRIKLDLGSDAGRTAALATSTTAAPTRKNPLGSISANRLAAAGRATQMKASATSGRAQQKSSSAPSSRNSAGSAPPAKIGAAPPPPMPPPNSGAPPKKRAAWDLKGRVGDLEARIAQQQQLSAAAAAASTKETEGARTELRQASEELEGTKRRLAGVEAQLDRVTRDASLLSQRLAEAGRELDLERQQRERAEADARHRLADAEARHAQTEQALRAALERAASKESALLGAEQRIVELERKMHEMESSRRRLHNAIMELKGNIRVFCRVRPKLDIDAPGGDVACFPDAGDLKKIVELRKPASASLDESSVSSSAVSSCGGAKTPPTMRFSFDRVFSPCESQEVVFEEVAQLVQSALDGFNVCIFAYGPTGSGKTFTMEGLPAKDPSAGMLSANAGIIPRAIHQLFETSRELAAQGWQHKFEASFLEIYNEKIHDLLSTSKDDVKCEIKMATNGGSEVSVTNLTTKCVESPAQVTKLLARAAQNRAVAATKCNERSSRSHSVFMLKIVGSNAATGESCSAVLNLVDLAGSERLKESGSEGMRLQETKAINKSLSCLGNVIMAIGNKDPHVPYRDSKLTHLLQPSLGGNSKCLMFLNVSQREEAYNETLISLRFAVKVNQCNIGTAQKKTK